jgi:hypothetical protein
MIKHLAGTIYQIFAPKTVAKFRWVMLVEWLAAARNCFLQVQWP